MLHPGVYLRYNTKAPTLTTTYLHEQYERTTPQRGRTYFSGSLFLRRSEAKLKTHLLTEKNATDATCLPHETTPKTAEDMVPPLNR